MSEATSDPYEVLGVAADVSDAELRQAYRALVKRHHPDHNGGSPESTARFAAIQNAYARISRSRQPGGADAPVVRASDDDPGIEQRIADLERELAATREAERRARASQEAVRRSAYQAAPKPTPEQLGHYETEDSFAAILDDAGAELSERVRGARRSDFTRRLTDLFGAGGE